MIEIPGLTASVDEQGILHLKTAEDRTITIRSRESDVIVEYSLDGATVCVLSLPVDPFEEKIGLSD